MIDSSALLFLDKNINKSPKSDNTLASNKPSNGEQGFSNYMEKSARSSETKESRQSNNQDESSEKNEVSNSNQVENKKASDSTGKKNEDESNEEAAYANNTATELNEDVEISTAALVNLTLQKAITSNIGDNVEKPDNPNTQLLANNQQTSALDALIQNTKAVTETVSKELLLGQEIKPALAKISSEVAKLLSDGKNGSAKLQSVDNKQELLANLQLKPVDEIMDIKRENSDIMGKLLEKMDLTKLQGESSFQNRLLVDKAFVTSDANEINLNRMGSENVDKNVLLNALNSTERTTNNAATTLLKMNVPMSNPEWGEEFGKRIQMLMKNNIQYAEIRMDPPGLGSIQVRINMNQDQANVAFTAIHANVREAIETNISRLREMLDDSGLQLGDADVTSQFQQQTHQGSDGQDQFSAQNSLNNVQNETDLAEIPSTIVQKSIDGVIDYFA